MQIVEVCDADKATVGDYLGELVEDGRALMHCPPELSRVDPGALGGQLEEILRVEVSIFQTFGDLLTEVVLMAVGETQSRNNGHD